MELYFDRSLDIFVLDIVVLDIFVLDVLIYAKLYLHLHVVGHVWIGRIRSGIPVIVDYATAR